MHWAARRRGPCFVRTASVRGRCPPFERPGCCPHQPRSIWNSLSCANSSAAAGLASGCQSGFRPPAVEQALYTKKEARRRCRALSCLNVRFHFSTEFTRQHVSCIDPAKPLLPLPSSQIGRHYARLRRRNSSPNRAGPSKAQVEGSGMEAVEVKERLWTSCHQSSPPLPLSHIILETPV